MSDEIPNERLNTQDAQRCGDGASPDAFPNHEFYRMLATQIQRKKPFAVATVVAVHGSASARAGSKAIISQDGRNVFGWVGGGCAESFVIQHSQEAILAGVPRVVTVDLNDEVFGVGMPCGGNIDVYIEPMMPAKRLLVLGSDRTAHIVTEWATKIGFSVLSEAGGPAIAAAEFVVLRPHAASDVTVPPNRTGLVTCGLPIDAHTPAEEAISLAARLLALETGSSGQPLWRVKRMPEECHPLRPRDPRHSHLVLVGHNRITESLATLAISLDWTVTVNSVQASRGEYPPPVCRVLDDDAYELDEVAPGSYVVIATQHKGDHLALRSILTRQPAYVGLIASRTRAELVMGGLKSDGMLDLARGCVHSPCGLDLGARSPFEIALAICCEMIGHRNSASD